MFTETNPDKGTETVVNKFKADADNSLQKLTPIRGRKPQSSLSMSSLFGFTETNPDKGTETISIPLLQRMDHS